jgi:hypothetical protein
MSRTSEIPAEILAEMTPALRAFVERLLSVNSVLHALIAKMQAEIDELKSLVKRLTPQTRIPATSFDLPLLRNEELWCVAFGSANRPVRCEVARILGIVDGAFSSE